MRHSGLLFAFCAFLAGCSAPNGTIKSSGIADYEGAAFQNILVIGVADNYDGRARFERLIASKLTEHDAMAVAYYRAVGGNKPISRETIEDLVESEGFDAVLITKVLKRDFAAAPTDGVSALKSTRKEEGALHRFRYDYQELNEPATLGVEVSVKLSSEVFDTHTGDLVWAIESDIRKKDATSLVVDEAVKIIVQRLQKDGLINRVTNLGR